MFINHTKRFVFLRVTKNASSTLLRTLIDNKGTDNIGSASIEESEDEGLESFNIKTATQHHNINEILKEGVLKLTDLPEYDFYGVLRDPVDRFISAAYHMHNLSNIRRSNYDLPPEHSELDEVVENLLYQIKPERLSWVTLPQQYWLLHDGKPINRIFLYEDIQLMMNFMLGKEEPIVRTCRGLARADKTCEISDKNREKIIELYRGDYDMYQELKNRRSDHVRN